jgi:SAM-dependent methyltransferase
MLPSRSTTVGGTAFTGNLYSRLAPYYDDVHTERRYAHEVEAVLRIGGRSARSPIRRVLDLFCGTGGHSIPFAMHGLTVTGVDSSHEMLTLARVKAAQACLGVAFEHGDCREISYDSEFDLVSALGQSFHYMVDEDDVDRAIRGIRAALRPGGILILDLIDPSALCRPWRAHRVDVRGDGGKVVRVMRSHPDDASRTTISETQWTIEAKDGAVQRERTLEAYRIFVLEELIEALRHGGFVVTANDQGGKSHGASPGDHIVTLVARRA